MASLPFICVLINVGFCLRLLHRLYSQSLALEGPRYTVIGGHSRGLGVFPVLLREFLMAGGAEFGKITAAGSAAGVEFLRQRGPPIGRKNDGSKNSRSHPGSGDSGGPAGPAIHRLQRDRAARLGGKAGARGARA